MMNRSPDRADARTVVIVAGLAAAAVLAGFAAPWLEFGGRSPLATDSARMLAVALLLCAAGAILLAQRALAARRNRALLARLAQGDVGEREVAFLGRRFEQTLAQLRRLRASRLLRPQLFVHELPWYLVIGAPGSGKTTALANSGLHFPLAEGREPQAVRGIGGTRNCDWWFASQAVLIDTAGRYTTQDSDRDADRTAWFGFLDLLRRHRPRRPLNGVLLTVSASDLLDPVPARLAAHAQELRARLDELRQRLQTTLPVYLLVTKTDLLPGFAECFADFDDGQRAQVWGATLPLQAAPARLAGELAALDARLQTHLQERLEGEHDPARRAALGAFATQWRLLARSALGLLQAVFDSDSDARDAARPLLRGLYFTSATQAAPQAPAGSLRSFFVTRLLRDLVFAESGLAGRSSRALTLRRLLERGLLGASVIALALALAALLQAYRSQSHTVDAVAARLPALDAAVLAAQRDDGLSALLPALDALDAVQAAPVGAQLAERLLDRREMLAGAAEDSSRRLLHGAFLSRIAARLEARLQRGEAEPVARTYETLRAYLMLFGGKHFDPAALRAYLADDWQQTLPPHVGAAERAALLRHLDRLLAAGEVGAPSRADAVLVAAARARVQGVSLAQRAATRLRQQGSTLAPALPPADGVLVRADGSALADAVLPSAAPLPPHERTRRLLAELAQEQAWVLGTPQAAVAAPALVDEVERLLVLDAAQAWQLLLDDLRPAAPRTLAASAQLARQLARHDGPALALLRAGARASPWLAALRAHVDMPAPQAAPVARTLALLERLAVQLDAADAAARRGALPPAPEALAELAQVAHDAPAPWSRWLLQLHTAATGQLQAALREPLALEASRHLAAWCASPASQRYPLVRDAQQELSRDEFVRAFGAGGSFDALQQRLAAPYGEAARGEALAPLRRALAVREAFFRDGGRALGTRLEFRLLGMDAGASEFTLEVDSQVLRFRRETRQAQGLEWLTLGGTGASGGRVRVHMAPSANSAGYVFDGPWALLRLLDRARVERADTPDRVLLVFDIEGRRARFEVRSSGAHHPLLRQELESLSCPNRP
jgi:type VI secretion system protein ImpL